MTCFCVIITMSLGSSHQPGYRWWSHRIKIVILELVLVKMKRSEKRYCPSKLQSCKIIKALTLEKKKETCQLLDSDETWHFRLYTRLAPIEKSGIKINKFFLN